MNNIGPNIFPNTTRPNNNSGRDIFLKALEQARIQKPVETQADAKQVAAPKPVNNEIKIPDEAPTNNIRKGMFLDIRV